MVHIASPFLNCWIYNDYAMVQSTQDKIMQIAPDNVELGHPKYSCNCPKIVPKLSLARQFQAATKTHTIWDIEASPFLKFWLYSEYTMV